MERNCWKSDKTAGCFPLSDSQRFEIPRAPLDAMGIDKRDVGDSDSAEERTNFGTDFANNSSDSSKDRNTSDWDENWHSKYADFVYNGTVCVCNTDLCNGKGIRKMDHANETVNSSLQTSGSSYFVVICVLILAALITLSTTSDDQL